MKLWFSVGVILGVFALMVEELFFAEGFMQSPALSFALILSIASVAVYNWLNRFDRGSVYTVLPLSIDAVFRAKYIAFFMLALPINVVYLLVSGYVYGISGLLTGLIVLAPLMLYVIGVTAYLTGMEPNKLLMDVSFFFIYTVAIGVAFVPLFVWAMLHGTVPDIVSAGMAGLCLVFGLAGYQLCRMAPGRWRKDQSMPR